MARKKKTAEPASPLASLIRAADAALLGELVQRLAANRPEVRRECLEFLQQHVQVTGEARADADAAAAFALWEELEPDLHDLHQYSGGPEEIRERVSDLLRQLAKKLDHYPISRDARRRLLHEAMKYTGGDSGVADDLAQVARATCKDDEDLRHYAILLEKSGRDWLVDRARRIYRDLGDRDKYLTLRTRRMEFGGDYYDLATFYWEHGEREQALAVAREGMQKARGRMDELEAFLAEYGGESADQRDSQTRSRAKRSSPGRKQER